MMSRPGAAVWDCTKHQNGHIRVGIPTKRRARLCLSVDRSCKYWIGRYFMNRAEAVGLFEWEKDVWTMLGPAAISKALTASFELLDILLTCMKTLYFFILQIKASSVSWKYCSPATLASACRTFLIAGRDMFRQYSEIAWQFLRAALNGGDVISGSLTPRFGTSLVCPFRGSAKHLGRVLDWNIFTAWVAHWCPFF